VRLFDRLIVDDACRHQEHAARDIAPSNLSILQYRRDCLDEEVD